MMVVPKGGGKARSHDPAPNYQSLRSGAQVIEADGYGEKVLRLRDGSYLKLFRRKRLLSSAIWYPYAHRFADNADMLARLGVACPRIIGVYRFADIQRDAVHYQPLPGSTLRQLIESAPPDIDSPALRTRLGHFVARLHERGVFFRSIHLGNIVVDDGGCFGLIDIADMRIGRGPLSRIRRRRNLVHMMRYREDALWLLGDHGRAFAEGYSAETGSGCPMHMLLGWLHGAERRVSGG